MLTVWQDAEAPIEFHAPELHFQNWGKIGFFGNLIRTVSPLIMIVITLLFAVMSYYVSPSTLLIKENPAVYPPEFFLAVGHLLNQTADDTVQARSFLYSNFPQFSENMIQSRTFGGRLSSAVNDAGYLDIRLSLPYDRGNDEKALVNFLNAKKALGNNSDDENIARINQRIKDFIILRRHLLTPQLKNMNAILFYFQYTHEK